MLKATRPCANTLGTVPMTSRHPPGPGKHPSVAQRTRALLHHLVAHARTRCGPAPSLALPGHVHLDGTLHLLRARILFDHVDLECRLRRRLRRDSSRRLFLCWCHRRSNECPFWGETRRSSCPRSPKRQRHHRDAIFIVPEARKGGESAPRIGAPDKAALSANRCS